MVGGYTMLGCRNLRVWQVNQECIRLSAGLLELKTRNYAFQHIAKQLFRSLSSIGANIAEGQDSHHGKEFIRYLNIAVRSAIESDHWLETLKHIFCSGEKTEELRNKNIEVIKMLKALRKSIIHSREKTKH